jgi:hypothetical protein
MPEKRMAFKHVLNSTLFTTAHCRTWIDDTHYRTALQM